MAPNGPSSGSLFLLQLLPKDIATGRAKRVCFSGMTLPYLQDSGQTDNWE